MDWTFLNNSFFSKENVKISPFDRGFLFGDSVYEVIPVYGHKVFLLEDHIHRLERSLLETGIPKPSVWKEIPNIIDELIKKNKFENQTIYLQVTRGVEFIRSHLPDPKIDPTLFINSSELFVNPYRLDPYKKGLSVKTLEDPRWARCDIKAVTLLSNIMALQQAKIELKEEVIFLLDGKVTEGAASNVFLVSGNSVVTPPVSNHILSGVTRNYVIKLLKFQNILLLEEELNLKDLYGADEVWMTSSTKEIQPVRKVDDKVLKLVEPKNSVWFKVLSSFLSLS